MRKAMGFLFSHAAPIPKETLSMSRRADLELAGLFA